jgi:hypothetical protein
MKKLIVSLGLILAILIIFVACEKTINTVEIITDRNIYMSELSSAQGINLTPNFQSNKTYSKLEYHWSSEEGEFLSHFASLGKEVKNQGESVLWSAVMNGKVEVIKNPFTISLSVIDGNSQKVLCKTKLAIAPSKGVYVVNKS